MIEIKKRPEDDHLLIEIIGEVDASSSIKLDGAIGESISEGHKNILIDASNLHYISSAGLGVFMSYIQELEDNGIKMIISGLNPKVENVFQILGLDQLLRLVESKDQAKNLF